MVFPYQVMNGPLIAAGARGAAWAARLIRRSHSVVKVRVECYRFALQTFLACGETFQTHFIAKTNGRKQWNLNEWDVQCVSNFWQFISAALRIFQSSARERTNGVTVCVLCEFFPEFSLVVSRRPLLQPGPDMESYFDISNDLKDVWDADIDPVSRPCEISLIIDWATFPMVISIWNPKVAYRLRQVLITSD